MKKRLITAALPYVNNIPHLGNLVQVLSADSFARFCKIKNYDVLYICGTDEYGTATETTAYKLGVHPKELCDKYHNIHKEIYDWFDIDFSYFGRTSTKKHIKITQDIFWDIYNNGYIKEKKTMQYYSEKSKMFLADRYLTGKCPNCGYESARGDQCDNCSKLLNSVDLINPKSSIDESVPILKETTHLYLDLEALSCELEKFVDKKSVNWSNNAVQTTRAWIKEGLQMRAITRDLKWGTPVPLEGFENKVFYVWFDAPIGYISITANLTDNWKDWWLNPKETELFNFVGKDNIAFHTVVFPSSLIGTKKDWTFLDKISSSEYLTYDGGKFSKSQNVGIFGDDAKNSGINQDMWRFYLFLNRPENSDYNFTLKDFFEKVSSHLIGNYANLVNRTLSFYHNFLSEFEIKADFDEDLLLDLKEKIKNTDNFFENTLQRDALKEILSICDIGNKMFQDTKPWELIKTDKQKTLRFISNLIFLIKDINILMYPYLPSTTIKVFKMLSLDEKDINFKNLVNFDISLKVVSPKKLFDKLDMKDIEKMKEKFGGEKKEDKLSDIKEDFFDVVDLVVGKVLDVKKHPDAQKLFILDLDDGTEEGRTIVSGLVGHYTEDELINKNIVVVANLKPAKFRGVKSQGMLLACSPENKEYDRCEVLFLQNCQAGDRLSLNPDDKDIKATNITKRISVDKFFSYEIFSVNGQVFLDKDKPLYINGQKIVTTKVIDGKIG